MGAPAFFHQGVVADIFALLGPQQAAPAIAQGLAAAGAAGAVPALGAVAGAPARRMRADFEQAGLGLGALALPPLMHFAVHYCLLHSLRHPVDRMEALPNVARAARRAGLVAGLTVLGATFGFMALHAGAAASADASALRVVFVGPAALTVPHMLLVDLFRHRQARDLRVDAAG